MAASVNVRKWFWVNHENSFFYKYRFLCSDGVVNVWTNIMAILTAIILARLLIVLLKAIDLTLPPRPNSSTGNAQSQPVALSSMHANPQPATGTRHQTIPHHLFSEARDVIEDTHTSVGGVLRIIQKLWSTITFRPVALRSAGGNTMSRIKLYWSNIRRESPLIIVLLLVLVICSILFGLECFGSIFSSYIIASDNLALSHAQGCGIYRPPTNGPPIVNASRNIQQETETDAANYARTCYDGSNGTDGCNFFSTRNIAIKEYHNQPCPFDKVICPEDDSGAFTLETDSFSAAELGINAGETYKIKRSATCTPLNTNSSFIREEFVEGTRMNVYYYGTYSDQNGFSSYTWNAPAEHNSTQYTGYNVFAFSASKADPQSGWTPHPALSQRKHEQVLLLLIGSHNVYHTAPRRDPVFPTNAERTFQWSNETVTYFTDATDLARPLACRESTLICIPKGTYCQPYQDGFPGESTWPVGTGPRTREGGIAILLTILIVASSNMFTSIRARLGSGLVASSKISQALSVPLAEEQWKVESRRLFQTSLAGCQIVARDISRATWAGDPGLRNVFDGYNPKVAKTLCGLYKFHANGWKNINIVGSSMTGLILLVILLASWEADEKNGFKLFVPTGRFLWKMGSAFLLGSGWVIRMVKIKVRLAFTTIKGWF